MLVMAAARLKKQRERETFVPTAPVWTAGKCCVVDCPMTMVFGIGAGRQICWLHALRWLPVEVIPRPEHV